MASETADEREPRLQNVCATGQERLGAESADAAAARLHADRERLHGAISGPPDNALHSLVN